ncbi:CwfJ domain-containing protein [Zopfia rhizophila CBS 207.26]|uniref:CwfJ domain-containing protein n=1 Tax=Zopfia rhizophila CBS 207.26 TaxID=1314779 RepID=A0A6A6EXZ5_9PEZI|nr:CwfJ domain-containing protein [Zopfia rhizophila CBS 207.26]
MACKILVVGDVNGQFPAVFQKISGLHAKNSFAFALVVGNLFASPETATDEDAANIKSLIDGKIDVPLTIYFALGNHALPAAIIEKLESSDGEVCSNLYFLGKRTTMKTSEGIRIVALGGQLDPNITAGASKDKYPPYYGETDAKVLRGAKTADIFITNQWPAGIRTRSKKEFIPDEEPMAQQCLADLCSVLKPRYHFSTSGDTYYEREPFFHTPTEETQGLYPITRFISLASFGNAKKQKSMYAFSLDPTASLPVSPPDGSTASPLSLADKKRTAPELQETPGLVYEENHHGRRHKRRRGEHKAPPTADECFFCLSNENIATHLITSIGDNAYVTTARGPLPTPTTFPELGFPCHMLIIPLTHQSTLAAMNEKDRHSTYTEMQRYRSSMNSMLKSLAGETYGSVTWELSKSSLMHTHWQYLPVPTADLIKPNLVSAAFKALAENFHFPAFKQEDVGDGFEETSDFFRVLIWDPRNDETKSWVMRFDESVKMHLQFGREVMAKLLRLDKRIDWHDCGQTQQEEEADVAAFKKAFKNFDFAE